MMIAEMIKILEMFSKYEVQKAADFVWEKIGEVDQHIQETEPFKLVKEDKGRAVEIIKDLVVRLYAIGRMLEPLLPETSEKILTAVKANKKPDEPLFPRK